MFWLVWLGYFECPSYSLSNYYDLRSTLSMCNSMWHQFEHESDCYSKGKTIFLLCHKPLLTDASTVIVRNRVS